MPEDTDNGKGIRVSMSLEEIDYLLDGCMALGAELDPDQFRKVMPVMMRLQKAKKRAKQ